MDAPTFGVKEAEDSLKIFFAPWVHSLGLKPVGFDKTGGDFVLPHNPALVHKGGIVCGQATASTADTAAVVTLAAMNGRFRMNTTVDLSTKFIRPLPPGDISIRAEVLSNGRKMAFVQVDMRAAGDSRVAVTATMSFAYLED